MRIATLLLFVMLVAGSAFAGKYDMYVPGGPMPNNDSGNYRQREQPPTFDPSRRIEINGPDGRTKKTMRPTAAGGWNIQNGDGSNGGNIMPNGEIIGPDGSSRGWIKSN